MAKVEVSRAARRNLDELIETHQLPCDTWDRLTRVLEQLEHFPRSGSLLFGTWESLRFVVGPWRWLLVVYRYYEDQDRAVVVTIQDGRTSTAVTAQR